MACYRDTFTFYLLLLKYVVVINFDVIGCSFFVSFVLRLLCAPLGVCIMVIRAACGLVSSKSVLMFLDYSREEAKSGASKQQGAEI
jgi:hypothetical protein